MRYESESCCGLVPSSIAHSLKPGVSVGEVILGAFEVRVGCDEPILFVYSHTPPFRLSHYIFKHPLIDREGYILFVDELVGFLVIVIGREVSVVKDERRVLNILGHSIHPSSRCMYLSQSFPLKEGLILTGKYQGEVPKGVSFHL